MAAPRRRVPRPKRTTAGPRPGYDDKRYRAMREELKRTSNNICHVCKHVIDLQIKYPHPLSWSCDHVIPRARLAPDDYRHWHISNARPAHLFCNESRGAKPVEADPAAQQTSFQW